MSRNGGMGCSVSLGSRVALGFGVVLALHASIALLALVGTERATDDLRQLDQTSERVDVLARFDSSLASLQSAVLSYTHTGNAAGADRARALHEESLDHLVRATTAEIDAVQRENLLCMRERLQHYRESFESMVGHRRALIDLVGERMVPTSAVVASDLQCLLGDAVARGDEAAAVALGRGLRSFLSAQSEANRHLTFLETGRLEHVTDLLDRASASVAEVVPSLDDAGLCRAEGIVAEIGRYRRSVSDLFRETRGYLRLVHTVMPGNAKELLRISNGMRASSRARAELASAQILGDAERFQGLSGVFSILTIVFGLVAGAMIARAIVGPIRETTRTLTRLAEGDLTARIPGLERGDELGEMARAAEVFKERSEETELLLEESRRLAKRYEKVIDDLESSNLELDGFAYVASHDLKAPLRAIANLSAWIDEDLGGVDGPSRKHLDMMRRRILRMDKLLDDLLLYSRAGRAELMSQELDVTAVATEMVQLLGVPDGFRVEVVGEPTPVCSARLPLEQIVSNLVGNSIKHHDRDSGSVRVSVAREGGWVRIDVEDDGPGIPEEHHARVFEMFKTLKRRDDVEGSGIGLSLVQRLVNRYGGRVSIYSKDGERGTRVGVTWPASATTTDCEERDCRHAELVGGAR
ncbi:MAG: ATP-binding protein [Planctomycetota bacterium JB042]